MEQSPATRASLLVRLRDPHDKEAWGQFVQLYAPVVYVDIPYVVPVPVAPVIDPYVPYWDRLLYACGVYGYC